MSDIGRACNACRVAIGDADRFCPGCGMPVQPKIKSGTALDTSKFKPSGPVKQAEPAPAPKGVVGKYEYSKPGSGGEKSVKYLTLEQGGKAIFREEGETSMETYVINGSGSWKVEGGSVQIHFPQIKKENKMKRQMLVNMGDSHVTVDDGMDIPVDTLANAPAHGVHKWKRV